MSAKPFAHSLPGKPKEAWEPLSCHLAAVGRRAADFAAPFGWAEAGRLIGLLHDIGKCSQAFQDYIAQPKESATGRYDHSTAGAREAMRLYAGSGLERLLAYTIAGHHAGLADGPELDSRLSPALYTIPAYAGWEASAGALPADKALLPTKGFSPIPYAGFSTAFLTRMLFSCLVDADFLETEKFYDEAERRQSERGGHLTIATLRDRLRDHMAALAEKATLKPSPVNAWRRRILEHAIGKASLDPGFFTMTVPTGGGKTLASLSFGLEHAATHGLRRIIYVIPFTSIIEQI